MTRPPIFADRAGVRSVWRFVDDRTMDIKAATAPSPVAVSEPPPIDPLADLRSQVSAMARLIAGSEPEPKWPRAGLANAVMALRFVILSEKEHPYRARLSDDLEYIGKIAPRLLSILEKRTIIAALEAAGAVELEGGHEACSDTASVVRGLTGLCSPRFELTICVRSCSGPSKPCSSTRGIGAREAKTLSYACHFTIAGVRWIYRSRMEDGARKTVPIHADGTSDCLPGIMDIGGRRRARSIRGIRECQKLARASGRMQSAVAIGDRQVQKGVGSPLSSPTSGSKHSKIDFSTELSNGARLPNSPRSD